MSKVVPFPVVPAPPHAPNRRIVELLRETLREAKTGRIQGIGIAIATVDAEGDGGRCTESIISYTDGWQHATAAAIATLGFRLNYERYTAGHALPSPELKDDDE